MKVSFLLGAAFTALVNAHTIFQRVAVDGEDQGLLTGVRSPVSDYPVQDVISTNLTCNSGFYTPISEVIISIPAGTPVATMWGHVIGGPQVPNDPDNPIASSHKGPLMYYLAKVDDSATTGTSNLSWFKIAQDGLNTTTGLWGVDRMIAGGGWSNFTLPSCLAPGNYLLRAEVLALHSAYSEGGAQFYMSCAQINVTGSGTFTGSGFLSLPGAYSATDPGILINIYGSDGSPDNNLQPYTPPGGDVQECPSAS